MEEKKNTVDFRLVRRAVKLMEESGLAEFEWESGGIRLRLKKTGGSPAVALPGPAAEEAAPPGETAGRSSSGRFVEITSPMVGTFYRSRSPDAPPLVEVGGRVGPRTVVAIIEAMKVMNEIEADAEGEVEEVLVADGTAVEYGQPLFRLRKTGAET